jgi:hypothetical protein
MSAWNWEGLAYIVKFNFMYLTEVHLQTAGVPFKAHWGKVNFIDPEFVRRKHDFDAFQPLVSPMFMNDYLKERIGQP